jgi:hypothetical protein
MTMILKFNMKDYAYLNCNGYGIAVSDIYKGWYFLFCPDGSERRFTIVDSKVRPRGNTYFGKKELEFINKKMDLIDEQN